MYRYVKDRRPSISPNFNFLGQLVEFDVQLTKQRADDPKSSSSSLTPQTSESSDVKIEVPERAPSPSKRPCMINLSHAVQSRKSLAQCADAVTVQSPTTALSRLQFVEQRQATSTAAVNVLPKSATSVAQSSPTAQSKSAAADASAGAIQQHEQQVASSLSSSSSSSSSVAGSHQTTSTTLGGEVLSVNVGAEHAAEGSGAVRTAADVLLVDWQTSFKSRSLEDILLESTTASPPRSLGHVTSRWTPADESRDESRLTGHASLATSHGSLSNGHASLHGSLEMIQVS